MQTPYQNTVLGKRAAPEDIAAQSVAKIQKLAQPTTGTECLFLDKLPQELRDEIYDYVAAAETEIGAHVTFTEDSNMKVQALSKNSLGLTCRQIRHEYSLRLESRIKQLVTELKPTDTSKDVYLEEPPVPALDHSARSHLLQIAERKVTRGVYVQEDIAYTMRIPFGGIYDSIRLPLPGVTADDLRLSTLTVTFASSSPRSYNAKYPLDASRDERALWTAKNRWNTLFEAAVILRRLVKGANWTEHKPWFELFRAFEILFPRREGTTGNSPKGRSDKDHWWEIFGYSFAYFDADGE